MISGAADAGPPESRTDMRVPNSACEDGAIAQLGERLNGIQEVGGSTPPGSTKRVVNRVANRVTSPGGESGPSVVHGAVGGRRGQTAVSIAGGQ
jgi:hypothetical protein